MDPMGIDLKFIISINCGLLIKKIHPSPTYTGALKKSCKKSSLNKTIWKCSDSWFKGFFVGLSLETPWAKLQKKHPKPGY